MYPKKLSNISERINPLEADFSKIHLVQLCRAFLELPIMVLRE